MPAVRGSGGLARCERDSEWTGKLGQGRGACPTDTFCRSPLARAPPHTRQEQASEAMMQARRAAPQRWDQSDRPRGGWTPPPAAGWRTPDMARLARAVALAAAAGLAALLAGRLARDVGGGDGARCETTYLWEGYAQVALPRELAEAHPAYALHKFADQDPHRAAGGVSAGASPQGPTTARAPAAAVPAARRAARAAATSLCAGALCARPHGQLPADAVGCVRERARAGAQAARRGRLGALAPVVCSGLCGRALGARGLPAGACRAHG